MPLFWLVNLRHQCIRHSPETGEWPERSKEEHEQQYRHGATGREFEQECVSGLTEAHFSHRLTGKPSLHSPNWWCNSPEVWFLPAKSAQAELLQHELRIDHIEPAAEFVAHLSKTTDPLKAEAFLQLEAGSLVGGSAADERVMPG